MEILKHERYVYLQVVHPNDPYGNPILDCHSIKYVGQIFSVHKERIVPCTSNGACSATIGGKNRCLGKISPPWYNGGDTCWGYGEHMHYKILKKEEVPKEILEE